MMKRDILRKTRKMWQWLADNPNVKNKTVYFIDNNIEDVPDFECYCCNNLASKTEDNFSLEVCEKYCALFKLFSKGYTYNSKVSDSKVSDSKVSVCDNNRNSPYFKWLGAKDSNVRKINAQKIADFCTKELKKMKDGI